MHIPLILPALILVSIATLPAQDTKPKTKQTKGQKAKLILQAQRAHTACGRKYGFERSSITSAADGMLSASRGASDQGQSNLR